MVSPSNKIRAITLLNNQGVSFLLMGQVNEACTYFARASTLLAGLSNNRQTQSCSIIENCPFGYNWIDLSKSNATGFSDQKPIAEGSLPFLFLRAVLISECSENDEFELSYECGNSEDTSPGNQSWAVLYNLALSCHLLACLRGEKGGRPHLKRSHDLYGIVLNKFLIQAPPEHRAMLALALFNNSGCIYREYAMHTESVACLKKVREILASQLCENNVADLKIFGLNVMVLQRPMLAEAA
jgi:hypothetical protein